MNEQNTDTPLGIFIAIIDQVGEGTVESSGHAHLPSLSHEPG
jgi:hypothetical protein